MDELEFDFLISIARTIADKQAPAAIVPIIK